MRPLKVLVVDDSALMRRYLRKILEDAGGFEVHVARDGKSALELVRDVDPDVVTLDINMPEMDGLTCLSHLMADAPRPVVMVSSLTSTGALATLEALALGAVDFVEKPGGTVSHNIESVADLLVEKVRAAQSSRVRRPRRAHRPREAPSKPITPTKLGASTVSLVLIGVSTGGPGALETLLSALPAGYPAPILVAQHMPGAFTRVFAERLDAACPMKVVEVDRATPLEPGRVHLARGDLDVVVERRLGRLVALPITASVHHAWHPSVSRMVASAMEHLDPASMIGVQLTGMGDDGAVELASLHARGGRTIAESEETAVVYGMPRELVERHGADAILPIHRVAPTLTRWACSATCDVAPEV